MCCGWGGVPVSCSRISGFWTKAAVTGGWPCCVEVVDRSTHNPNCNRFSAIFHLRGHNSLLACGSLCIPRYSFFPFALRNPHSRSHTPSMQPIQITSTKGANSTGTLTIASPQRRIALRLSHNVCVWIAVVRHGALEMLNQAINKN